MGFVSLPQSEAAIRVTAECVRSRYPERVKSDIPSDELERAQARVDQLLEALRRETARLASTADSALAYSPDQDPK
jgi:hypothetical protein